ncbi:hypothetical protein [Clostridium tagluense]|uniref:Uncharacterized protein n=1 Tax=Clostridium tagluense TaxID=360422 RepID=A0A401UQD5_9CLOT|nr:hypothetical protein [Clostridium tagluense]GCD11755.1 hypothetical protein Ctaglu_33780 [Clostridium tagluense]
MSEQTHNKLQQIFDKVELLKTDENTKLMLEVWDLLQGLEELINVEEVEKKTVLQQKLNEISKLL